MSDAHVPHHYRVTTAILPIRASACEDAECTSECLFGERVFYAELPTDQQNATESSLPDSMTTYTPALSETKGWVHIRAQRDGYTGFVQTAHLQREDPKLAPATHRVCTTSTLLFDAPSIKSRVLHRLPLLSHFVATASSDSPFYTLDSGGFIWREHALSIDRPFSGSPLALAQSHFMGAPYLWGGCTPQGVDCSGLIQALACAKGLSIPRDSGDQETALVQSIEPAERQAQDIVYWPGHTGILVDKDTLLHATAHTLRCVIEPLDDVVGRAGKISSVKRLFV